MPDKTGQEQGQPSGSRQFPKGQSGNPTGRPKGARNRTTMAVEELLEGEAAAITRKAIEMALGGDSVALRLCMDRIAPVRRGRPVYFDFSSVERACDVSTALGDILKATSRGDLTPEEAATIAGVLEVKRKAIETADLEARLAAVERTNEGRAR